MYPDFKDLLSAFHAHGVKDLIFGGYAVLIKRGLLFLAVAALLFSAACQRGTDRVAEPSIPEAESVTFDLEPLQSEPETRSWRGIHLSRQKIARFRIQLGPVEGSTASTSSNFVFRFGEGKLLPEWKSDSGVFLADLQKALQSKTLPATSNEKRIVPFTYAIIGDNLSQKNGGGFSENPPGNWTALKLFFGEGDQESQVFLNINAKTLKGQFSIKDPDYGDLILAELAKVL